MSEGIAYQNKDIASKVFAETFGEKSLSVYGLHIPRIVRILPTNLPAIQADEMRIDNLFLLEDGTVALIDYESGYDEADKIKYGNYMMRVSARYVKDGQPVPAIRMIVIYTADVERKDVAEDFDRHGYSIHTEAAFLSELDSQSIREKLARKVAGGEELTEEDLMEFIVLPLTYRSKEKKQEMAKEAVRLAMKIGDRETAHFVLSGLLVFTDKVIDEETRRSAKEVIRMTWLGRMYEEEKQEAVRNAVKNAVNNEKAKQIVGMVENISKNLHIPIAEACAAAGIGVMDYDDAVRLVGETAMA